MRRLEFLDPDAFDLLIVHVYVALKGVQYRFDDVVEIPLHFSNRKVEQSDCHGSVRGEMALREDLGAGAFYPLLPSNNRFGSFGLERHRGPLNDEFQRKLDFDRHCPAIRAEVVSLA
jgi:hypothetical protein